MIEKNEWIKVRESSRTYAFPNGVWLFEDVKRIKISNNGANYLEFNRAYFYNVPFDIDSGIRMEHYDDELERNVPTQFAIVFPHSHTVILLGIDEWTF